MTDKVTMLPERLLHKGGETLSDWEQQLLRQFARKPPVSQDIESIMKDSKIYKNTK